MEYHRGLQGEGEIAILTVLQQKGDHDLTKIPRQGTTWSGTGFQSHNESQATLGRKGKRTVREENVIIGMKCAFKIKVA